MINIADSFKGNINEIRFYSFSISREFSFKAFLTDFNDQYTTNWNSQEIYGRMDPIHTYKNTTRKITLGFDVPNFDVKEAIENAKNADLLIRSLYPVYETNKGLGTAILSSPPLFKIKFANLITNVAYSKDSSDNITAENGGLMGWIDGYGFKPELDSGFFIEKGKLFPKLFKVNFNFNIIHEHPLGVGMENGKKLARPSFKVYSHNYGLLDLPQQTSDVTEPNTTGTEPSTAKDEGEAAKKNSVPNSSGYSPDFPNS
jgi:hypothetical protein